jgi:hypothetical protein
VLTIHARLIAETGGTQGLRDEALLESALTAAAKPFVVVRSSLLRRSNMCIATIFLIDPLR